MTEDDLAKFDRASRTRYIEFELGGKKGSLKAESAPDLSGLVSDCELPLIAELRRAVVVIEGLGAVPELVGHARRPMREEVIRGFFFYHYAEMRSYHRNADNPMERGDAAAAYLCTGMALAHVLRAGI